MRNHRFGSLLSEGLLSVAHRWRKTKASVEYDIYEKLLEKDFPLKETTIRGWCRGFVPHSPELVAWLVEYCVAQGRVDRSWAESLLVQAVYPERETLLTRIFALGRETINSPLSATAHAETNRYSHSLEDPLLPILSAPRRQLIGRDECIRALRTSLLKQTPLLALHGLPGVGKTTITLALAQDQAVRERFCDGVLWAGLGQTPNLSSILNRWSALLGLQAEAHTQLPPKEIARALRMAIGQRSILLVIDDAWNEEDARLCLVGGPNCTHLITTRIPELALTLADSSNIMHLSELNEEDGVHVLARFVPTVVQEEPMEARALARAAGGLPLALTILGAYLQKEAYSGQPRRVHAALEALHRRTERLRLQQAQKPFLSQEQLANGAPLSLASSIEASYRVLAPRERSALLALATFPAKPNTFSEEAALAVIVASPRLLDTLLDAGLLESAGTGRYMLHQTIVDFARSRHVGSQPGVRFLAYFVRYFERFTTDYAAFDQEVGNIQAALQLAIDQQRHANLVSAVVAFAPFMLARGLYQRASVLLTHARTAARAIKDNQGLFRSLLYLGQALERQGKYTQAEEVLQEGLVLARQDADGKFLVACLDTLGYVTILQGKHQQAESYLQEGLVLARAQEDIPGMSSLLRYLGNLAGNRGELDRAESYYQEALELAQRCGRDELRSRLLMGIGILAAERGDCLKAESMLRQSLQIARKRGIYQTICLILANLGELLILMNRYDEALTYVEEGLVLARQINHRQHLCNLLQNYSSLLFKQRAYEQAIHTIQESLDIARELQYRRSISISLNIRGEILLHLQRMQEAQTAYTEALDIAREGDDRLRQARALFGLAQVAASGSCLALAHDYGQQSLALLKAINHADQAAVSSWLHTIDKQPGTPQVRGR